MRSSSEPIHDKRQIVQKPRDAGREAGAPSDREAPFQLEVPTITLPTGGGAIKSIDEQFTISPSTGTLSMSMKLPLTPGRHNFTPAVSLAYDSGSGNGVVGLGWSISIPSIRRRTDRGVPLYRGDDVFMLTGSDDLVASSSWTGDAWTEDRQVIGPLTIQRYRPRIERDFALIEQITDSPGDGNGAVTWWRVVSRDDVTTIFGFDGASRIADPQHPDRVQQWLPSLSFDDLGNCCVYEYKPEDLVDVAIRASDANRRRGTAPFSNLHLTRIRYGNRVPYYVDENAPHRPAEPPGAFLFHTVFDYGEHDPASPTPDPTPGRVWAARPDPFSTYRGGFEVRTHRLLQRVLMFHEFDELNDGQACLVRSLDLAYSPASNVPLPGEISKLASATQNGYVLRPDGQYSKRSLPPIEFDYEPLQWSNQVRTVDAESATNLPVGVAGEYQWLDLYSEGIAGVFTEQANAWLYKANLGDAANDGQARLDRQHVVLDKPSLLGMNSGDLRLQELEADGRKQIVVRTPQLQGFFELVDDQWSAFQPYPDSIRVDLTDTHVRMLDLVGDGRADILISEQDDFVWYRSLGKRGHDSMQRAARHDDEERSPAVVFADDVQSVFLADMSGDGLTDIVRIRNGDVCYWPNRGYGRFGARVAMDNSPHFDDPARYDARALRLADITGTGTTDLIYLGDDGCSAYLNLSGNGWSDRRQITTLRGVRPVDVSTTDLLGNGTPCLVWSSGLPRDGGRSLRYIDLMNGRKPHLLTGYRNNLGRELSFAYKTSTWFYLRDKLEGRAWVTRLPFPVHCIRSVELRDRVAGTRSTNSYRYHHGYFDPVEREFRGFAMVEQVDAEDFANWARGGGDQLLDRTLFQTAVLTKTWFHTGVYDEQQSLIDRLRGEYWDAQLRRNGFAAAADEPALPTSVVVPAANIDPNVLEPPRVDLLRQAMRACRGTVLRSEVFGLDAPEIGATPDQLRLQLSPYTVTTHNCQVEVLQPIVDARPAVITSKESEAITFSYERDLDDPRVQHTLHVLIDEYGNVRESATASYGRRVADATLSQDARNAQARTGVTYVRTEYTADAIGPAHHRLRQPSRTTEFEITGVAMPGPLYTLGDFVSAGFHVLDDSTEIPNHDTSSALPPPGTVRRRMLRCKETVFYDEAMQTPLPLHQLNFRALPFESYELAFTPELLTHIFGGLAAPAVMAEGRYVNRNDANWWVPSGRWHYLDQGEVLDDAKARFFTHVAQTDPFGARVSIGYLGAYALLRNQTTDAADNRTSVDEFDLRVMSPRRIVDPNGNISEVLLDELGWVKATAVLGKGNEADNLTAFEPFATSADDATIAAFFNAASSTNVVGNATTLLHSASARYVYDTDRYRTSGGVLPPVVATIVREQHAANDPVSPVQVSLEYSNGAGKVEMKKVQAEPGIAKRVRVLAGNTVVVDEIDLAAVVPAQLRWVGTGRKVLNNKGSVVKEYEPFFSVTHQFESAQELVEAGVTCVRSFDPVDRPTRVDHPDGTFAETRFAAWRTTEFDRNDTASRSVWHDRRVNRLIDAQLLAEGRDPAREADAAVRTEAHADTPFIRNVDAFGQPIVEVADNGVDAANQPVLLETMYARDVQGRRISVTDPRGNVTLTYGYDMRNALTAYDGPDGGRRLMLDNVVGDPLRMWDERNHEFVFSYDDPLHRVTTKRVVGGDGPQPLNHVFERLVYGEGRPNDAASNLRTQVAVRFDTAGRSENTQFDLHGNLAARTRRFAADYRNVPNWDGVDPDAGLDVATFETTETYDALDRITSRVTPDGSVHEPAYNAANLLDSVRVTQGAAPTVIVTDIDYDARGLRRRITLGSGVTTTYSYDGENSRLIHLVTRRANGDLLQDLSYTYDPVGNLTHVFDAAIPTVWFGNAMVTGESTYRYDPSYRLVEATGREHAGQLAFGATDNTGDLAFCQKYDPNDALAWRSYTEQYRYDSSGNIDRLAHAAGGQTADFTRDYIYDAGSNRLLSTSVGADSYLVGHHPQHGFVTSLPHLSLMRWNFRDVLQAVATQVVNAGQPETTWYVYDGDGMRVRKVTDRSAAADVQPVCRFERYSFEGIEIERDYDINLAVVQQRHTTHVMDDRERVAMIERDTTPGSVAPPLVRYQCANHIDSARLETDETGKVISYEEYHPFGTTAYQAVDKAVAAAAKRYRYTGMERDTESGLEYHAARYYIPWLARWLSPDLHADQLDGNRYAYVKNNPTVNRDRNGQFEETVHGAATYRLALAAGFTPDDAAKIAIATAGMDHDAQSMPGKSPDLMPQTKEYHFASQEKALGDIQGDIKGGAKDLEQFGRHLHTLEDVGFKEAPGPHMRAPDRLLTPLLGTVGGFLLGASVGLGVLAGVLLQSKAGQGWVALAALLSFAALALGAFLVKFAVAAEGVGHPSYTSEHGDESISLNHVADQAYQDPRRNRAELERVYDVLKQAADEHYGQCRRTDDAAKDAAITGVVNADTFEKIDAYLNAPLGDAVGGTADSYVDVVKTRAQGRWTAGDIDASVHNWFIDDPSYTDWLKNRTH